MTDDSDTLSNLLGDIVFNLRERAEEACAKQEDDFSRGRALAYAEVLQHIQNMADSFGVARGRLGLDGYDPIVELSKAPETLATTSNKS